jgi:hypothetical protein
MKSDPNGKATCLQAAEGFRLDFEQTRYLIPNPSVQKRSHQPVFLRIVDNLAKHLRLST